MFTEKFLKPFWSFGYFALCHLNLESLVSTVPANIYKVSEDITVNEGSNVTLSCLASGRPDPMITWRLLNPSGENYAISVHYCLSLEGWEEVCQIKTCEILFHET